MNSVKLDRRAVLHGIAGAGMVLPVLEAMGSEVAENAPRRFCAMYTANGMSLPRKENEIHEWNWFPQQEGHEFQFGRSTEPLAPFRDSVSFMGGMYHPNGPKADPHVCSDMWLTGAPLHDPKPGTFNSVSLDQVIARHTRDHCRQPSLVLSIDAGTGYASRTSTISYNQKGIPIPAENNPRLIFDALFFKLHHSGPDDPTGMDGRNRPRTGSLLFTWVPTSKVTVSGNSRENARHTSSNGFTGVRGDRRMQHGIYLNV